MDYFVNGDKIAFDPEIRRYRKDSFAISGMATDTGIDADETGRKIVPIGTLIDKDGNACKISGGAITGTPIGITTNSVEVTHGPQPVGLYTRGHFQGELLNLWSEEKYTDAIGTAIETALPEVHIYPRPAYGTMATGIEDTHQKVTDVPSDKGGKQ